ncbi:MAG: response regulator [Leptospira sp.]|nr:response regulator [Leptospira sp.]NCS92219.1 response regulator [Leptospira sp.]
MVEASKKAILCVDDEKIILQSLNGQLKSYFKQLYRLEFAESADEALELIDDFFDDGVEVLLILSDWLMPGMKGDEFLIKVHEKYPKIKKIMLTGQADPSAIENAREYASLTDLVSKPWDENELISKINQCLA